MKILVIPDIHGSENWKSNYLNNINNVDRCVFLGDYVDSFNDNERGENAALNVENILNTVDFSKTDLLLGNHDISYCYKSLGDNRVSGHQYEMTERYGNLFEKNKDKFKIAVEYDGWVFSHAGFTSAWVENTKASFKFKFHEDPKENPIELSNELWQKYDCRFFNYNDHDWSGYGDSILQGPAWCRPSALSDDMYYDKQVVGHTEVENSPLIITKNNKTIIICDSRNHDTFFILDTEKKYESNY